MYSLSALPGPWTFHDLTLKNCFDTPPSSIKANFSQWIQMQCHYYFNQQLFCTAIRNFETENGGKIPLWSIKVNISTRKAILTNIFQFTNILRAAKICGYKFENDLESNYFRQVFVYFSGNCAHLGQDIYPSELSHFWCHSNNWRWCWLSERVQELRGIWTKLGKHLKLWCLWMKLISIQP